MSLNGRWPASVNDVAVRVSVAIGLISALGAALALAQDHQGDARFVLEHVPLRAWAAADQIGGWPAPGATLDASALSCEALGPGGGPPTACHAIGLARELREASSRLAACYTLRPVTLARPAVRAFARTGAPPRPATVLFVRDVIRERREVRGPCRETGIDACMGTNAFPVVGFRWVTRVEHRVVPWASELVSAPFDGMSITAPWVRPERGDWPRPPGPDPFDEGPLREHAAPSRPDAVRFAAWVDLVAARLFAADAAGARASFAEAVALAPTLTDTPFVPPDLLRAVTAADARAIAAGPEPAAVRHAHLRALLGARLLRDAEAARTVGELARDLGSTLRPAATDAHVYFRGTDARVFVPEVLGELSVLLHLRWSDPCAR